ncbi:MAG: zf-HC2 domain-containing protein [Planctomycetes bacterium]|nr:zf-HC2 domain-containing protein [Planctomycetota bacterium]
MNCSRVRKFLTLYLDSELSAEASFEVSRHLETCADCRARMEGEARFEAAANRALSASEPEWTRAWERAASRTFTNRRRRFIAVAAAASILAIAAGVAVLLAPHREIDISRAMTANHRRYLAGDLPPAVEASSTAEIERYFAGRLPFAVTLGKAPSGAALMGARSCYLDRTPCGHIVAHVDGVPVSFFLIETSQLGAFPEVSSRLAEADPFHCESGPFRVLVCRSGDRVLCAIGELSHERLETATRELCDSR